MKKVDLGSAFKPVVASSRFQEMIWGVFFRSVFYLRSVWKPYVLIPGTRVQNTHCVGKKNRSVVKKTYIRAAWYLFISFWWYVFCCLLLDMLRLAVSRCKGRVSCSKNMSTIFLPHIIATLQFPSSFTLSSPGASNIPLIKVDGPWYQFSSCIFSWS